MFQKRVWEQFLHHILCMIIQEKCFCYILVIEQLSLSGCLFFLRYSGLDKLRARSASVFRAHTFCLVKKKKTLNLHVFGRTGKTMKKLQ